MSKEYCNIYSQSVTLILSATPFIMAHAIAMMILDIEEIHNGTS